MIRLLLLIALVGVVVWLVLAYVPLPDPFGSLLVVVAVLGCALYAYRALGGPESFP